MGLSESPTSSAITIKESYPRKKTDSPWLEWGKKLPRMFSTIKIDILNLVLTQWKSTHNIRSNESIRVDSHSPSIAFNACIFRLT